MLTLEDILLALSAHACTPYRAGRSAWRARCPVCDEPDSIGLNFSSIYGLSIAARCRCARALILDALGVEDDER